MLHLRKKFAVTLTLSVLFALFASQVGAAASPIRGVVFSLVKANGPLSIDVDATCHGGAELLIEETKETFTDDDLDGGWHIEPTTLKPDTSYTVTIKCTNKTKKRTVTAQYSLWYKNSEIKAARLPKANTK